MELDALAIRPKARKDRLLVREVDGDTVVYDLDTSRAHNLNPTAARVWELCDEDRTVTNIAAVVEAEMGLPHDPAAVLLALKQLDRVGLLESGAPAVPRISRRAALARLGKAAAVAALLPAVTSIVAPRSAEAASCAGAGASCTAGEDCCSGLCVGGYCIGS